MSNDGGYTSYAGEDIVTGEGVSVEIPAAGLVSRMAARAIDIVITVVLLLVVGIGTSMLLGNLSEAVIRTGVIVLTVGLFVILPVVFETLTRGRTPGKYAMGLITVRDDGGPITLRHSVIRQLVGFVEIYAFSGGPAVVCAIIHPRAKRLGDVAAGTYVLALRQKLDLIAPPEAPPALEHWVRGADLGPMPPALTISVRQFLTRTGALTQQSRDHIGRDLSGQVLQHVSPQPPPGVHPEWILRAVLAERRRRDLDRLRAEGERAHRLLPADPLG